MTRAAQQLGVTTSALSRTISLLEDELGVELFTRSGGHIALSHAGAQFLVDVRNAMRLIDDGLGTVHNEGLSGSLRIAGEALFSATFVLPALAELRQRHPALLPQLGPKVAELERALLTGALDVAFGFDLRHHPELVLERLGATSNGVYVGLDHPLASSTCTFESVARYPAVTRCLGPMTVDRWPAEIRRHVALHVTDMQLALYACAKGGLVAVLPDALVLQSPAAPELRRLTLPELESSGLFALHREPLRLGSAVEGIVSAVRGVVERVLAVTIHARAGAAAGIQRDEDGSHLPGIHA